MSDLLGVMGSTTQSSEVRLVDVGVLVGAAAREVDSATAHGPRLGSEVVPGEFTIEADLPEVRDVVYALMAAVRAVGCQEREGLATTDAPPNSEQRLSVSLRHARELPAQADEPFIGKTPEGDAFVVFGIDEPCVRLDQASVRRLFDPMFTPTRLFTPEQRGTARRRANPVGLASALGALHSLGGGLRVVPLARGGLRFEAYFPSSRRRSPQAQQPTGTWQGHGRILVVDDEPSVARLTGLVLDQQGFQVEVACSGGAALELITKGPAAYRLIVVDLSMPDLSGVEVMRKARELGCSTPMVLTSGHSESEAGSDVRHADFAGYLQKPYRLETLLEVIRRALVES